MRDVSGSSCGFSLLALVLALAVPGAAGAVSFLGLGSLPGGTGSLAFGLSADGSTVVGSSGSPSGTQAFRWSQGGGMQGLGTLGGTVAFSLASGVSGDGSVVVGESNSTSGREAFVWTSGGGLQGLGDLSGGSFFSQARGVSDDGTVVVGLGTSGSGNEAFRWTSNTMTGLGDLAGGQFSSEAFAASADGSVVVGFGTVGALPSTADHDAFRWTQPDGLVPIGDPFAVSPDNEAYGVSPDGSFVSGQISDAATDPQAFLWTAVLGMQVLGDLAGGVVDSAAFDVSADGTRVVGRGDGGAGHSEAILWEEGVGLRAVSDVLTNDFAIDLSGWQLFEAVAISDDGNTIAGWGRHDGVNEAWLFVVPEPASGSLLALGLAALAARRRRPRVRRAARVGGVLPGVALLLLATILVAPGAGAESFVHLRGALHEHSGYSDGEPGTTPASYYAAGAAAGLDFLGSGEHSDSEDIPLVFSESCLALPDIVGCAIADPNSPANAARKWEATAEQAAAASTPSFTGFRGFEWTSDRFGHINVYFSRQAVNAKIDGGYAVMETFWPWLAQRPSEGGGADGLAVFNHPDDKKLSDLDPGRNWNDFAYVPEVDVNVVGMELFNDRRRDDYEDWFVRALDKGWHIGAVGAEDSHGPTWADADRAKTVLIARDRSPGALYEAMLQRRMYAELDADLNIEMSADGEPMGSQLARRPGTQVPIAITVSNNGGAPFSGQLDLVTNAGAVVASAVGDTLAYAATASAAERYYYLRVTTDVAGADKVVAYSSPVWIREAPYAARGSWVAGDLHVHTTYSHDSYGPPDDDNTGPDEFYTLGHTVGNQFLVGAVRGLDYLAITDHNDVRSQADVGFGSQGLIGVPSYENSLSGHAQMHGATHIFDKGDSSAAAIQTMADALRAEGGVFQVNHPADDSTHFPEDASWRYFRDGGYAGDIPPDTVEILNIASYWQPPLPASNSIDDAIRYWEGWLDRGHRVAATGGSDNHWISTTSVQGAGQPTTWVFVSERSARGVLEGMRAGRTMISYQPPAHEGPRVFLEADANLDGVFEAIVGDRVPSGSRYRVRVEGGSGMLLDLVRDGSRWLGPPIQVVGEPFVHEFVLDPWDTWVRAQLYTADLDAERTLVCDGVVGEESTYCRNSLAITGLTSAIFQGP